MSDPAETSQDPRFTLKPQTWYAAEFFDDGSAPTLGERTYSPIRIEAIHSSGDGNRRFELTFYHANYPEGVRNKKYSLVNLHRGASFLLARSIDHSPARILFIHDISWKWLQDHFRVEPTSTTVERWLDDHA